MLFSLIDNQDKFTLQKMYHRMTIKTLFKATLPHLILLLIVVSLTFSVYLNVLHGDTQFDDERYIFEFKSPQALLDTNFWESLKSGARPLTGSEGRAQNRPFRRPHEAGARPTRRSRSRRAPAPPVLLT